MEKPVEKVEIRKYYDYSEIVNYIEYKYDIKTRDYLCSADHYDKYLAETNQEKYVVPDKRAHAQFINYCNWTKISGRQPEYLDFWHWLSEIYEDDIYDGCIIPIQWEHIQNTGQVPPWVQTIIGYILTEFPHTAPMWCKIEWSGGNQWNYM